jgi:hypothetical protein
MNDNVPKQVFNKNSYSEQILLNNEFGIRYKKRKSDQMIEEHKNNIEEVKIESNTDKRKKIIENIKEEEKFEPPKFKKRDSSSINIENNLKASQDNIHINTINSIKLSIVGLEQNFNEKWVRELPNKLLTFNKNNKLKNKNQIQKIKFNKKLFELDSSQYQKESYIYNFEKLIIDILISYNKIYDENIFKEDMKNFKSFLLFFYCK